MRVILVIVLCLSSGFWTNGLKQNESTERTSTDSDLELNSTTSKSVTDKGTIQNETRDTESTEATSTSTPDSTISNEITSDFTVEYITKDSTTIHSTKSKTEHLEASTDDYTTVTTEPSMTTTTIPCLVPKPPVLYFDNYEILWYIEETPNCIPDSVYLKCGDEYSWTFKSNVSSLNVLDAKITQGRLYFCDASLVTTTGKISDASNLLQLPPGTRDINPILSSDLTLQWDPPFENVSLTYFLNITGAANHTIPPDCDKTDNRLLNTSMTNISLKADFSYNIIITTSFWELPVTNLTQLRTASTAPGPPRDVDVNKNTSGYYLTWSMPCDPNGELFGYNIALVDNPPKITESISDINIFNFFTIQPEPSTQYFVSVSAIGTNDLYGEADTVEFVTDALPNTPNLIITFQNATFFIIRWNIPPDGAEAANITKYELNIDILGPTYTENPDCPKPSPISGQTLDKVETEYSFDKAWPSYQYNFSLTAYSVSGQGPTGFIIVTTNYTVPEAPKNLTIVTKSLENNIIPVNIHWMDPCKINGNADGYWIEIQERYTEEQDQRMFYNNSVNDRTVDHSFNPSHEYFIRVAIQLDDTTIGSWAMDNITTDVGYPGLPILNPSMIKIGARNLSIPWQKPLEKTGPIELYELTVKYIEPMYEIPKFCSKPTPNNFFGNISPYKMNQDVTKLLPYSNYDIKLRAKTISGFYGNFTTVNVTTLESDPDIATNITTNCTSELTETYKASLNVYFNTPCNLYGTFQNFTIKCNGKRQRYGDVNLIGGVNNATYDSVNWFSTMDLVPQYNYSCNITTFNKLYQSISNEFTFKSPAGEPNFNVSFDVLPVLNVAPGNVQIHLKKIYFESWQADAQYIALLLNQDKVVNYTSYKRTQSDWPALGEQSRQITPDFWYPFHDSDEIYFTVGNGSVLNPALNPDQNYHLSVRVITDTFYTDSPTLDFTTAALSKAGLIVGVIISILLIALLGIAGFFIWKKNLHRKFIEKYVRRSVVVKPPPLSATAVPVKKFVHYFQSNKNKPEVFKQEFAEITEKGKEIQSLHTCNFAGLSENRRKNRYVNILPFDASRVKLLIDEDDEIGSDYINASYVKGYSGDIEYIATQGPLATTCRDFWKLVLQENVTIIVMVANFVEKNKIKCHKYFPENHENLIVGDNMEIRCATELHFGTYVVRNLQIRKDLTQVTVTHMQFLEWPDFRVPAGTEHMLQFCHKLRERIRMEGGIMIVHCSAGVGRTGTLIAADILLQTAAARKPLDVYKTVLDLRKQRCMMVQTEEQYIYVHRLLADHIDRPATPDAAEADPVYENMDMIKRRTNTDCRSTDEEESGF
ncbi:phosphatidylinositol phosphatase PTPRQ-like [Diabrotica undecimpunctata]|uniref:phosphatidylinositol phosphatase PTPRQ-like n=1 Tax=Diabrotica undecimpunctata TaxID=50387 RepID=UPI003B642122